MRQPLSALLLIVGLVQALVNPGKQQHNEARDIDVGIDTNVKVVLSSFTSLEDLAKELEVSLTCLIAANPLLWLLNRGDNCIVPQACCGSSCKGKFCSKRPQCHGQTTSTAPVQTGISTTCYSTLTMSVSSHLSSDITLSTTVEGSLYPTLSSSSSNGPPTSTGNTTSDASSTAVLTTSSSSMGSGPPSTTNSPGQSVTSSSSAAIISPSGSSSTAVETSSSGSIAASQPSLSVPVGTLSTSASTTTSSGQTVTSTDSSVSASPTSVSSESISPPGSSISTDQPPTSGSLSASGSTAVTNSVGSTISSSNSDLTALPTSVFSTASASLPVSSESTVTGTSPTTAQSDSSTGIPSNPSDTSSIITTTNSAGETIISTIAPTASSSVPAPTSSTIADGSASASGSSTVPSSTPSTGTTTDSAGDTATSNFVTDTETSAPSATTFTDTDGSVIVSSLPSSASTGASIVTTTDSTGGIITSTAISTISSLSTSTNTDASATVSGSSSSLSSGSSTSSAALTTTSSDGVTTATESEQSSITASALPPSVTTTNSDGSTITTDPTATSSPNTTPDPTLPSSDGPITSPPSSSTTSDSPAPIYPVTTSVTEPKATENGTEIPCDLWFFFICISWLDLNVLGWKITLPPGTYPPGPPPAITFPPALSISISISGTLPDWPSLTIGPDNLPTYEPEPEECETESAELCLTSTSFGVSSADGTVTTTASSVLSTCATVYGCEVSDSSSSTSSASTTTSEYPFSCTVGCIACNARRELPAPTDVPSLPTPAAEPKNLISYFQDRDLAERDIPNRDDADVIAEFYEDIDASPNTVKVIHDNAGQTGITSSRFRSFDASEVNIQVTGLVGCTAVLVVSRLGAYISHIWEPSFTEPRGGFANFQTDAINYLNTGRAGGEANTQPLGTLVQNGIFGDVETTKIFIMTPATYDLDLNDKTENGHTAVSNADQRASLTNGGNQPLFDGTSPDSPADRLTPLRATLSTLMPGVEITQFVYRRQNNPKKADEDAYGKAAILYSNLQLTEPGSFDFDALAPTTFLNPDTNACEIRRQKAVYQCWIQGQLMNQDLWDALPNQIAANQKRQAGDCSSPTSTISPSPAPSSSASPTPTSIEPSSSIADTTSTVASTSAAPPTSSADPSTSSITSAASSSTFSTSTRTSSAPSTTTVALPTDFPKENIICKGADELPGHASIDRAWQQGSANQFCIDNDKTDLGPGSSPATKHDPDDRGVDYFWSVSWKENCAVEGVETQNVNSPIDSFDYCWSLMINLYLDCDNGGIGGYRDVGCLRYEFTGGL